MVPKTHSSKCQSHIVVPSRDGKSHLGFREQLQPQGELALDEIGTYSRERDLAMSTFTVITFENRSSLHPRTMAEEPQHKQKVLSIQVKTHQGHSLFCFSRKGLFLKDCEGTRISPRSGQQLPGTRKTVMIHIHLTP